MPSEPPEQPLFVLSSQINSFWYLYRDAATLHQQAKSPELAESFQRVPLSRTAILLYIFSLEALINRALDRFLESPASTSPNCSAFVRGPTSLVWRRRSSPSSSTSPPPAPSVAASKLPAQEPEPLAHGPPGELELLHQTA